MILFLAQESSWNQGLPEVVSSFFIASTIIKEDKLLIAKQMVVF